MEGTNVSNTDGNVTVDFNRGEYAQYLEYVKHTKQRNVAEKVKESGLKAAVRRQTLVMRRTDVKSIAPDEDIAAYGEIHKLKNPTADPKQKTIVTDNEIKAYKALDPEFKLTVTLQAIDAKVEELKAAGELTNDGDVAEEVDEPDGVEG